MPPATPPGFPPGKAPGIVIEPVPSSPLGSLATGCGSRGGGSLLMTGIVSGMTVGATSIASFGGGGAATGCVFGAAAGGGGGGGGGGISVSTYARTRRGDSNGKSTCQRMFASTNAPAITCAVIDTGSV